jgi:hypothetical protein
MMVWSWEVRVLVKKRGKKNKRIWDLREKRHKGVEKGEKVRMLARLVNKKVSVVKSVRVSVSSKRRPTSPSRS